MRKTPFIPQRLQHRTSHKERELLLRRVGRRAEDRGNFHARNTARRPPQLSALGRRRRQMSRHSVLLSCVLAVILSAVLFPNMVTSPTLSHVCKAAHYTVEHFLSIQSDRDVVVRTQRRVQHSLSVLKEMADKYSFDQVAVSYNGGKDCLVMVVLYLAVLHEKYTALELDSFSKINAVLINYEPQFPELTAFIQESSQNYSLKLLEYNDTLKEGFAKYLFAHTFIETIVVGTRRTDPYAKNLKDLQRTDSGWPDFVRCHPVVDWTYDEIWCFLKMAQIDYCVLYDQGYTSLGGVDTTVKNPWLKDEETGEYKPAYLLENGDEREREGRFKR